MLDCCAAHRQHRPAVTGRMRPHVTESVQLTAAACGCKWKPSLCSTGSTASAITKCNLPCGIRRRKPYPRACHVCWHGMLWCQYGLTSAVRSGPKEVTTSLVTPTEAQRQVQFQLLVWHMHCTHDDWCFEADSTYQYNAEQQIQRSRLLFLA